MTVQKTLLHLMIFILSVFSDEPTMDHHLCKTRQTHGYLTLDCSHQNLSYIPYVDSKFQILIFAYNNLTNITAETFGNVSNPGTLVGLELDHNNIRTISKNAFDGFPNLTAIYLSNNPVYYDNLKHALGALSRTPSLHEIRMSGIRTIEINKDLFSLMEGNHIRNIGIEFYDMTTLSIDTFEVFTDIMVLHLENNNINELVLAKSKSLRSLYLKYNNLEILPKFSLDGNGSNCYFPALDTLDVKYNKIKAITKDSFRCLWKLTQLSLAGNSIKTIPNNVFSRMPMLTFINVEYLSGRNLHIEPFAFRSKSLEILQLGFRASADAVFDSLENTFSYSPNLKHLTLSHIILLKLTCKKLSRLFSPLSKLEKFKCYACQLNIDPKCILKHMKNAESINLESNLITTISDETFIQNKRLNYLNLRYNQLAHISQSAMPVSLLNTLLFLDLSQNPFVCDCDLQWFITWMKSKQNETIISRYPKEYKCSKPVGKQNVPLSDITFTYRECHPWSLGIWFAIIGSPCLVLLCICVTVLYRNRWNIKHYIFLLRKRRNYQKIQGNEFMYNAFVAYEKSDSVWVRRRLLPVLEKESGLKLCIHERDFQAGAFINDNIVTNIEASEKVIVVLTNAFARSGWCMFELKVAHSKLIEDETEVIVILLEKIYTKNMNQSLRVLFDTTTYIEWTEDAVGQELFWLKLRNALKK